MTTKETSLLGYHLSTKNIATATKLIQIQKHNASTKTDYNNKHNNLLQTKCYTEHKNLAI